SDRGGGGYGGGRADVECAVQSTDQEERQNPDAGHGGNLYPPRQSGRRARQRCFAAPLGKATPTRPAPLDQVIEAIRTVTPATADADERNENQYVGDSGAHIGCADRIGAAKAFGGAPDQQAEQRAGHIEDLAGESREQGDGNRGFDDAGQPDEKRRMRGYHGDPQGEPATEPTWLPMRRVVQVADIVNRELRRPCHCGIDHPYQSEGDAQRGAGQGRPGLEELSTNITFRHAALPVADGATLRAVGTDHSARRKARMRRSRALPHRAGGLPVHRRPALRRSVRRRREQPVRISEWSHRRLTAHGRYGHGSPGSSLQVSWFRSPRR